MATSFRIYVTERPECPAAHRDISCWRCAPRCPGSLEATSRDIVPRRNSLVRRLGHAPRVRRRASAKIGSRLLGRSCRCKYVTDDDSRPPRAATAFGARASAQSKLRRSEGAPDDPVPREILPDDPLPGDGWRSFARRPCRPGPGRRFGPGSPSRRHHEVVARIWLAATM